MNIFFYINIINIHHKSIKLPTLFLSIMLLLNTNIKIYRYTIALPSYKQNNVNDCTYVEVVLDVCLFRRCMSFDYLIRNYK